MRVAVIIPTTEGPALVLKLTPLAHAPRSVLRTQDDYRPLPPSSRYNAFIQPGGPLDERIGLRAVQFELRLGAKVETGRSWELPVALVHWLQVAGHQIDIETPDLVIWATGALDNDLQILKQDYYLQTKLELSGSILKDWLARGVPVLALLPELLPPSRVLVHHLFNIEQVTNIEEAITAINRTLLLGCESPTIAREVSHLCKVYLLFAVAAVILTIALFWSLRGSIVITAPSRTHTLSGRDPIPQIGSTSKNTSAGLAGAPVIKPDTQDPTRAPGVSGQINRLKGTTSDPSPAFVAPLGHEVLPRLILEYAPDDADCRLVIFGTEIARHTELAAVDGVYRPMETGKLCVFGFTLQKAADVPVNITLPKALIDWILPSDRREFFTLGPGDSHLFRLRADLPALIEGDVAVEQSQVPPLLLRIVLQKAP